MFLIKSKRGKNIGVVATDKHSEVVAAWQKSYPVDAGEARIEVTSDMDKRLALQRLFLLYAETDDAGQYHAKQIRRINAENVDDEIVKRYLEIIPVEVLG